MTRNLTITKEVHFRRLKRGQKVIVKGPEERTPDLGSVPRLSRLMALAIHMDGLICRGEVTDYADLALLAHVSRARITQIMNLLHLAPDIQESILYLPLARISRDGIPEKSVRPLSAISDWQKQRALWNDLLRRFP